jgi:hypothetical protein
MRAVGFFIKLTFGQFCVECIALHMGWQATRSIDLKAKPFADLAEMAGDGDVVG